MRIQSMSALTAYLNSAATNFGATVENRTANSLDLVKGSIKLTFTFNRHANGTRNVSVSWIMKKQDESYDVGCSDDVFCWPDSLNNLIEKIFIVHSVFGYKDQVA